MPEVVVDSAESCNKIAIPPCPYLGRLARHGRLVEPGLEGKDGGIGGVEEAGGGGGQQEHPRQEGLVEERVAAPVEADEEHTKAQELLTKAADLWYCIAWLGLRISQAIW